MDASSTLNFAAMDLEFAHADRWSICQIGLVIVDGGTMAATYNRLIRPPGNRYSEEFSRAHGIMAFHTEGEASFIQIWKEIANLLNNRPVVCYDVNQTVTALEKSFNYYGKPFPEMDIRGLSYPPGTSLIRLAAAMHVEMLLTHNALVNAMAVADIYLKMQQGVKPDFSNEMNKAGV